MSTPPPSRTEDAQRLAALRALEVLDTAPEPVFDAMTAWAARACGVPIALIALADADRHWFKSNAGWSGVTELRRDLAFCEHAPGEEGLLEVPDAAADPRFAEHTLVTGEPRIRFFAGAPIVLPGGERIGTFCVIDRQPRRLEPSQRETLRELAGLTATCLRERSQALALRRDLAAEAQRYRSIVDGQAELVSLADRDGTLTLVNPAYARHFDREVDQMLGRNLLEFVDAADRAAVRAHIEQVCVDKAVIDGVNRHRSVGGRTRWVAWSNRPVLDAKGQVRALQSVGRDITEQRLTEDALAASETRYRRLYEATPAILHSSDADGRLFDVSDRWLQLLGHERAEVIGRPAVDFMTPESRQRALEEDLPRLHEHGRIDNIEFQFQCKDGSAVDVLLSATLERNGPSDAVRSLAILQDISRQKSLAAELGRTHTHLDNVLNNVPVMLGYWDRDKVIRFANREFEDGIGQPRARFIGQSFEQLYQNFDPECLPQALGHVREVMRGRRQEFECAMLLFSGLRLLHVSFVPDRSAAGDVIGFYGMWIDVTGRRNLEMRLRAELDARMSSESRLRVLTDHLPALVSYLDGEQRFQFANKAYTDWFGIDPQRMVGKTLLEFYGPDMHRLIEPHFKAALGGQLTTYERQMRGAGAHDHVQVTMVPHCDEHGAVVGVYTLIHDIGAPRTRT